MSVYTAVDAGQLKTLLLEYPLGTLLQFSGIEAGIENTNYFVTTTTGEYVLTIFEHVGIDDLQFDLQLMEHMARADIPCPLPLHRHDGALLSTIADKPSALVSKLHGQSPAHITVAHCGEIGHWLARLHHREFHRPGELTLIKPPEVYEKILCERQTEPLLTAVSCG